MVIIPIIFTSPRLFNPQPNISATKYIKRELHIKPARTQQRNLILKFS